MVVCEDAVCDRRKCPCEFRIEPVSWDEFHRRLDGERRMIAMLYQSGLSVEEVAGRLRMDSQGIRRFLLHRGILRSGEDAPVEDSEQIEMALL